MMDKRVWLLGAVFAIVPSTSGVAQLREPRSPNGVFAAGEGEVDTVARAGRPVVAFRGCDGPAKRIGAPADPDPQQMILNAASRTDPTTARVFASIPIAEGDATSDALENDCRFRLDGIWVQDTPAAFDARRAPDGFGALPDTSLDPKLTHASFTTPVLIYVDMAADGNTLTIRPATQGHAPLTLHSTDGVPLSDVFVPSGALKTYVTEAEPASTLEVKVTRTGRVHLRWVDRADFYRPEPTVSESQSTARDTVFLASLNLDNLDASLRGYDIVTQDPFQLNLNSKQLVFAEADPRDYAIVERRTVPLGLKLVADNVQGTVTSRSLISSSSELQKTFASSFGMNVGFTKRDADSGETVGSLAAGASSARSGTIGSQIGMQRSLTVGFVRHKLYTLVLDRPFAQLSDEFIDAVDDARRFGRYRDLIEKFGTHFPYAVTYGSQGRMWASFSQDTVADWRARSQNVNYNAGLALGGFDVGVEGNQFTAEQSRTGFLAESEESGFDAVGGTGSASEAGHGTGLPAPILADLRPLHELLNPLHFPNEPEVYGAVRERLEAEVTAYLEEHANREGLAAIAPAPVRPLRPQPAAWSTVVVDGDRLNPTIASGGGDTVTLCVANQTGWNKGIGRAGSPDWLSVGPRQTKCLTGLPAAPNQRFDFYKAKTLGIMTKMQTHRFNLTGHEGNRITLSWTGN